MTEMSLDLNLTPTLARGCRLGEDRTLLMPEGLLKLSETAERVIKLCDGSRTLAAVVEELQKPFPPAQHARIRSDILAYVERLLIKKALELR